MSTTTGDFLRKFAIVNMTFFVQTLMDGIEQPSEQHPSGSNGQASSPTSPPSQYKGEGAKTIGFRYNPPTASK